MSSEDTTTEVPISLVAEPDGVGTTGLIDTGASFDAPAWSTIEM